VRFLSHDHTHKCAYSQMRVLSMLFLATGGAAASFLEVRSVFQSRSNTIRRGAVAVMAEEAVPADIKSDKEGVAVVQPPEATEPNEEGECVEPVEAYFCNEQGCWVGEPQPVQPVVLPDGRTFCMLTGVQSHEEEMVETAKKPQARRQASQGIFAPIVTGTKRVMGEKELNQLRAEVIGQHSKVIAAFVDTSESQFGQIVLKRMFEAADKDDNGTLDREEIREALHALGFKFIGDKQLDIIFQRADMDGDEVIDFEEFVKETPKTLRSSLTKLAKQNGHDLGFLA